MGLLGTTKDNCNKEVTIYSDDFFFVYCVYSDGYEAKEEIINIQNDPDKYMFTPYVEFVKIFNLK